MSAPKYVAAYIVGNVKDPDMLQDVLDALGVTDGRCDVDISEELIHNSVFEMHSIRVKPERGIALQMKVEEWPLHAETINSDEVLTALEKGVIKKLAGSAYELIDGKSGRTWVGHGVYAPGSHSVIGVVDKSGRDFIEVYPWWKSSYDHEEEDKSPVGNKKLSSLKRRRASEE